MHMLSASVSGVEVQYRDNIDSRSHATKPFQKHASCVLHSSEL